jgi:hypothetical protein
MIKENIVNKDTTDEFIKENIDELYKESFDGIKKRVDIMIKEGIGKAVERIIKKNVHYESLRNEIKEFWKADKALAQVQNNIHNIYPIKQSHPQSYRTSRLLDFTKKLNEILNQQEKEIFDGQNTELCDDMETSQKIIIDNEENNYNSKIMLTTENLGNYSFMIFF